MKQAPFHNASEFIRREEEKEIEIIRHRNDLPNRDELPYRNPEPKRPTLIEIMEHMRQDKRA